MGAICPLPIGTYRYRKVLSSGASRMTLVDVFPLAVTTQLDDWKEAQQRTRRWFSLAEAASLVDEPELSELLLSFSANSVTELSYSAAIGGGKSVLKEGIKMFHWFQALLPRQADFFSSLKLTPAC
jgi:hypothetical protein